MSLNDNYEHKYFGLPEGLIGAVLEVCMPCAQGLIRSAGSVGGEQFWEAIGRSEIPVYGVIHVPEHEILGKQYFVAENGIRQYSKPLEGPPRWTTTDALATLDFTDVFPVRRLEPASVVLLHEVNIVYDVLAMKRHRYPLLALRGDPLTLSNHSNSTSFKTAAPALVCRTLTILHSSYLDSFGASFCCADHCRGTSDFEGVYFFAGFPTIPNIAASIIHHQEVVKEDSIAIVDPKSGNGSQSISDRVIAHRKQWNAMMCVTPWLDEEAEADTRAPCPRVTFINANFFKKCHYIQSPLDLAPFRFVSRIDRGFLQGCSGLRYIDLSPLENLIEFGPDFLRECSGLQDLDLTPLFPAMRQQANAFPPRFLYLCKGIRQLDFTGIQQQLQPPQHPPIPSSSPTSTTSTSSIQISIQVDVDFLFGCTGLEVVELGPILSPEPRPVGGFQRYIPRQRTSWW